MMGVKKRCPERGKNIFRRVGGINIFFRPKYRPLEPTLFIGSGILTGIYESVSNPKVISEENFLFIPV
jgi:hypothetical protein